MLKCKTSTSTSLLTSERHSLCATPSHTTHPTPSLTHNSSLHPTQPTNVFKSIVWDGVAHNEWRSDVDSDVKVLVLQRKSILALILHVGIVLHVNFCDLADGLLSPPKPHLFEGIYIKNSFSTQKIA